MRFTPRQQDFRKRKDGIERVFRDIAPRAEQGPERIAREDCPEDGYTINQRRAWKIHYKNR